MHRPEEQEWHVVFKLTATTGMKMVLLADLNGTVTDCNLLAQTALKHASTARDPDGPLQCTLADIGLSDFGKPEYRRINGSPADVRMGERQGECMVQVESLTTRIYG